jgi:amino acid transporter
MMPVTRTFFAYAFDGLLPKIVAAVDDRTHTPWGAIGLTLVLTELFLIWSLLINNFIQVLSYAVLIQLISMSLVGVAAMIVPWRKPDLYRAGATQARFLGIPVISIAGAGALLSGLFVYVLYFAYPAQFGLTDKGQFLLYSVGTLVAAVVFLNGVKLYRRRQGHDLALVYAEVPPE